MKQFKEYVRRFSSSTCMPIIQHKQNFRNEKNKKLSKIERAALQTKQK